MHGGSDELGNVFSVGTDGTYLRQPSFLHRQRRRSQRPVRLCRLDRQRHDALRHDAGRRRRPGQRLQRRHEPGRITRTCFPLPAAAATSGRYPDGSLVQSGSTLYGMTNVGGARSKGNVFSVAADGTNYQNVFSFTGTGGAASGRGPQGSLILSGTTLYGMTNTGGANGLGNVFSVGTDGTNYHNLLSFTGTGGAATGNAPGGGLTISGSTLYGMTFGGGAGGQGNVFSVGTDGTNYQNLLSFTGTGGAATGKNPHGSLILSGTMLYGMTYSGGANGDGNIFSVGTVGTGYHDWHDFNGGDGWILYGDLALSGGTLFGMTNLGGIGNNGTVFALTLPALRTRTLHARARRLRRGRAGDVSLAEEAGSFAAPSLAPFDRAMRLPRHADTDLGNSCRPWCSRPFFCQPYFCQLPGEPPARTKGRKENYGKEYGGTLITARKD